MNIKSTIGTQKVPNCMCKLLTGGNQGKIKHLNQYRSVYCICLPVKGSKNQQCTKDSAHHRHDLIHLHREIFNFTANLKQD